MASTSGQRRFQFRLRALFLLMIVLGALIPAALPVIDRIGLNWRGYLFLVVTLTMLSVAFGFAAGALVRARPDSLSGQRTCCSRVALLRSLFILSLVCSAYIVWARYRAMHGLFDESWPYPDPLLVYYIKWLDYLHTPTPGYLLSIHGPIDDVWRLCDRLALGAFSISAFLFSAMCRPRSFGDIWEKAGGSKGGRTTH